MIGRLLITISRMVTIPVEEGEASPALQDEVYRDNAWVYRGAYQANKNAEALQAFGARAYSLKMPVVPAWMGPHPAKRALAPVTGKLTAPRLDEVTGPPSGVHMSMRTRGGGGTAPNGRGLALVGPKQSGAR